MWSDTPPLRDMQFVQGWTMYPGLLQGRQADDARCGLANWHTDAPEAIPAVGGAMDLCEGLSAETLQSLTAVPLIFPETRP